MKAQMMTKMVLSLTVILSLTACLQKASEPEIEAAPGGSSTVSAPVSIDPCASLIMVGASLDLTALCPNGSYKLTQDVTISLSAPVAQEFNGTIDGNGHTIHISIAPQGGQNAIFTALGASAVLKNAILIFDTDVVGGTVPRVQDEVDNGVAAIAVVHKGLMQDLTVTLQTVRNVRVSPVGGLVAYSQGGTLERVNVTATMVKGGNSAGGIVGLLYSGAGPGVLRDSSFTGSVQGYSAGGLVGTVSGANTVMENSTANAQVGLNLDSPSASMPDSSFGLLASRLYYATLNGVIYPSTIRDCSGRGNITTLIDDISSNAVHSNNIYLGQ